MYSTLDDWSDESNSEALSLTKYGVEHTDLFIAFEYGLKRSSKIRKLR